MTMRRKTHADLLVNYLKPQGIRVALLAMLLFSSIALQLLNPQILRYFIDSAISGSPSQRLTFIALLFIAVALIQQLLSVAATYVSETVGWIATNTLRADLAMHCLRLDPTFYKAHTPGELIERIDGDVSNLANFFSQLIIHVLGELLLLIGILVLLFAEDWKMGLALTAFAIISVVSLNRVQGIAVPFTKAARQATAELSGFLEERLNGTEDICSSGAQSYVLRSLYTSMRELLYHERQSALRRSIVRAVPIALITLGSIVSFLLIAYLFPTGAITIGTVFLIFYYTELLMRPLTNISTQMEDLQQASACIERIQDLFQTESVIHDGPGANLPRGALSVEFDNVCFGYDSEGVVVQNVSFRITPGHVLGLLGRTGSGKTTLARLLFRLYDPQVGVVRIGGVDLRTARRPDLRQQIGMVTQDVQLFHGTIRDNLTFFDPHISDERILHAIKELGLWRWYSWLPNGLDTVLPSGNGGLSAGEAQLLAFARVFLKNPGLVILDEASSRLDPATEHLIEHAMDRLLEGRTAIVIAHRLTTIQRANEIMILEEGRIYEHGAREELVHNPHSRFSQLLQSGLEEVLP